MSNRVTLLELVTRIAAYVESDDEVARVVAGLVNSGAVELCGNFRGHRFPVDAHGRPV